MTAFERELRRVLADPPVEVLPDAAVPLAGLERRVTRARRRRTAASAVSVAAVLAFGVSGAAALTRPIPAAPANADAAHRADRQAAVAGPQVEADTRRPPDAVLDAARRAVAGSAGVPAGKLRWVKVGLGNATVYFVQIPMRSTTSCRVCRDPAAIPSGGAVIELRVGRPQVPYGAAARAAPDTTFPGYTTRTTGTASDLSALGTVYEYPVPR
jgi:hypothetical protein